MIDFVAYHDLQAQCGKSVYNELIKTHECTWRINPDQKYQGSDTLVMLDHCPHHPDLFGRYKHKFHIPHDIGEFKVYSNEHYYLKDYTAIFAPTTIHKAVCDEILLDIPCHLVGWSKYDYIRNKSMSAEDIIYKLNRIYEPKIMYAPTSANTYEWIELLPELKKHGTVLIKNHIYLNKDQPPPKGFELVYQLMLRSADEMEEYAKTHGMIVAPRRLNACELFEDIDVLISDTSSLLAEFLPFGLPVETGRCSDSPKDIDNTMSSTFPGVVTWSGYQAHLKEHGVTPIKPKQDIVQYDSRLNVGKQIADIIRGHLDNI